MMEAEDLFNAIGYEKTSQNTRWTVYETPNKDRQIVFRQPYKNYGIYIFDGRLGKIEAEPTPEEQKAIEKQKEELGWL